jgi:hypothetical protein
MQWHWSSLRCNTRGKGIGLSTSKLFLQLSKLMPYRIC